MVTNEEFLKVYDRCIRSIGRTPTVREVSKFMGSYDSLVRSHMINQRLPYLSAHGKVMMPKYGPPRRPVVGFETAEMPKRKTHKGKPPVIVRAYRVTPPPRPKNPDVTFKKGKVLPGHDLPKETVMIVHCARCYRRIALRPRMHAWWCDAGDGELAPVCSAECAGTPIRVKTT